jgi:predicted nuclease of predicted toxin-antitoxin system
MLAEKGLVGEPDDVVARAAASENRMLVTLDKDLGDLRSYPPGTHPGIIMVRLSDQSAPRVTTVLRHLLQAFDLADLTGCLTVVEDNRVRIRRP